MTKKQILVVLGIAVLVLVAVVVVSQMKNTQSVPVSEGDYQPVTRKDTMVPVPEKLEDMTATMTVESADDFSALDEEVAGVKAEIDIDSESVTNLGTSYDENSF